MNRIPKVRDWKVTDKETGRSVIVTTINKRFARWEASDQGINGNVTVSAIRRPVLIRKNGVFGIVN
jgi:hypothetical protein